jgi:hypothetical protein
MTYLRSLFLNFLIVFFVVRVIPGITIHFFENIPNIGADILFSGILGFLNSIIVPVLFGLSLNPTILKIAILGLIISFFAFVLISIFNFGITANTSGVIFGSLIVWLCSFFTNYLELKHLKK